MDPISRHSAVDELFSKWNKESKYEIARSGVGWERLERIPFSSPRLNYLTYGGICLSSLTEFSGPEGAGKTCAAFDIIANAQKKWPERDCVFFDVEGTFDSRWANKLGVDIDSIKYVLPKEEYAEQIFQYIIDLLDCEDTDISVIVLDSVAALIPRMAYENEMEKDMMGGISRPLTRFCNRVSPLLRKKNCALILINQVRDDMNSTYGGTTTIGGHGLKHMASMRLEFRRSDFFDENGTIVSVQAENPAGHLVKVRLLKTKVCRPDRKVGFFTLRYLTGIDYVSDLIDVGLKLQTFTQKGAYYYAPDENGEMKSHQGKAKFSQYMKDNPNILKMYQDSIDSLISAEENEEEANHIKSILEC